MHWRSTHLVIVAFLHTSVSALALSWDDTAHLIPRDNIDGDAGFGPDNFTVCDYTVTFDTLLDLRLNIGIADLILPITGSVQPNGTMRSDCIAAYALDALITMLDTTYNNYTVINDGYDQEFDFYMTYMKKTVAWVIDNNFMFNTTAATDTENIAPTGPGMKYFDCQIDGESSSFPCTEVTSSTNYEKMATKTTKMTLKDKDGYLAALQKAGISPEWVHLGPHTVTKDVTAPHAGRKFQYHFTEYPIEEDNMSVPNPKDIITKALPSIPALRSEMQATLIDIMLGNWAGGTSSDAAFAYSTPVFMLMQAVESMAQAKALGQKEEKAEEEAERNFIVMIISAVLLFVPVVGEEVATAAGLTSLARGIALASEAGNGALAIYDSVTDPNSAVINILGMLVGVGGITKVSRDAPGLTKVAKVQRTMDPAAVGKFGSVFKSNFDTLKPVMKFCKWS